MSLYLLCRLSPSLTTVLVNGQAPYQTGKNGFQLETHPAAMLYIYSEWLQGKAGGQNPAPDRPYSFRPRGAEGHDQ